MCGTLNGISDALTGAADAVGLKDAGDSITEGLGIQGPGDLLADFDDALYDVGVRWDSVGQIAAVAGAVYTGGVLAGSWGQGGWLANALGVNGATAAGATGTFGSTATGSAASMITNPAVAGQYAADLAAMGVGESAIATELAASGLSSAAAGEIAMGTQLGLQGSQLSSLAAGSMTPTVAATPSMMGYVNSGIQSVKDAGSWVGDKLGLTGATNPVTNPATNPLTNPANGAGGFLSNPMVQYGLVQAGGQMVSGIGAAMSADEKLKQERDLIEQQRQIAEDSRQRRSYWSSVVDARNRALAQRGLIGSNMA